MPIAFNSASQASQASGTTLTFSHTTAGSDRFLIVSAYGGADGTNITGMTYAGVAMTFIAKAQYPANNSYVHVYYLINPASGANNVVISYSPNARMAAVATSYTGVRQSGQPDAFNTKTQAGASSITQTLTVVATGSWAYAAEEGSNVTYATTVGAGLITTMRGGYDDAIGVGDSNGIVVTGGNAAGFSGGVNHRGLVVVSFAPAPEVVGSALFLGALF
jgi:hypothetical protein